MSISTKNRFGLLWAAMLFSGLSALTAQSPASNVKAPAYVWAEHISFSEGLNLSGVRDFCSDRHGMVWAAGQRALVRFSGASFQYYFPADSVHHNGLGHGEFYSLDTDASGRVWTSNASGVYWFDETKDSFCLVKSPFELGWPEARRYIAFDAQKQRLWLADEQGLYWIDMGERTWQSTVIHAQKPEGLLVSKQGKVIISNMNESVFFDPSQNRAIKQFVHSKSMFETSDGAIWLGTWRGGLCRLNPVSLEEERFFPPTDYKPDVYGEVIFGLGTAPALTGDQLLWCGTQENGVFFFDIAQKRFVGNLNWDERKSTGLPRFGVGTIFSDPSGVLWMDQGGMTRITPFRQQLIAQKVFGLQAKDSRELTIRGVLTDLHRPNYQWLAVSYYGLASYNTSKKEVEKWWFYHPNAPVLKRERNYRANIAYDKTGNLWASTETGFMVVDKKQKKREISIKTYNNATTAVNAFLFDNDNHCWMATNVGLCVYNDKNQQVKKIENPASTKANSVQDLKMGKGGLWLATENGLHFYDLVKASFTAYSFASGATEIKSQNKFYGLLCTRSDQVYAINDQGLATFHQGKLRQLCTFPNAHFTHSQSIVEDIEGYIWVIAFAVLRKIDPNSGEILGTFNTGGGYLQGIEAGKLQISDGNSIIRFDPITLSPLNSTCKPILIHFKVYDKRLAANFDSATLRPLLLDWRQNAVTFDFDCPDFTSFTETTYETMLEGYDNQWKPQGKKRSLTFTNLSPGDYVFYVRATNMAGAKHPENAVFRFRITPPFWQTWWFRLLSLGLVSISVYLVFRSRVHAIKREESQKTEFYRLKAETEMRALRAQMNPHFIFNCMNTIEAFIVEQREEEATLFLQKFSKLIRAVLENAQHDFVCLTLELEVLEWYIQLERIRTNDRWGYDIFIAPDIDMGKEQVPPLILQPFVENAILHGLYHRVKPGGVLRISISRGEGGFLLACITDNGIGRAAAASKNKHLTHKKKSLGTQFSIDRVRKLNRQGERIYDVSMSDLHPQEVGMTGTLVEIRLPSNEGIGDFGKVKQ